MEQGSSNKVSRTKGRKKRFLSLISCAALVVGLTITVLAQPAGADSATYSSAQIGMTGNTPSFSQGGPWTMSWSYDCSGFGAAGNFAVIVNGSLADNGTNELGMGGSGTDYYYDTGTFSLAVISECAWTITVNPGSGTPTGTPVTITSGQIGTSGNSQAFSVGGPWTLAWVYDCSGFGAAGNFIVNINQPPGDLAFDAGVNELGPGGSGVESYSDTGVFTLSFISECSWSVTVDSTGAPPPSPAPAPPPPAKPAIAGMAATPGGGGYWLVGADGGVFTFGNAAFFGSMGGVALNKPIVGMASTPDGQGYWLVASDGGIFCFGDAQFYGSTGDIHLNKPIVGMAPTPDGRGYWFVASDGGVFSGGDAGFFGSTGNLRLNKPVVGMAATPDGQGYYLDASDGGIFTFGDAHFQGSMGGTPLNKPVVGMATDPATGGYWEVAGDGGIFSFGAPFFGSTGNLALVKPIVGMTNTPTGQGYRFVASDGGIFDFGDAQFYGSGA